MDIPFLDQIAGYLGLGGGVGGGAFALWQSKRNAKDIERMEDKYDTLKTSLANHKVHAAETFATKSEVKDGFDRMEKHLVRIEDKIEKGR